LPLDFLTCNDVHEYFQRRFSPNDFDGDFEALIHSRTDGNPLFMVAEAEFLKNNGSIELRDGRWQRSIPLAQIEIGMPKSLRDLIERQITRMTPESQALLQIASVAGANFSTSVISAVAETNLARVEETCEALTRSGLLIRSAEAVELPDGSIA